MKLIESIMQTWKTEELPGQYRSAVDTWKLKHPSWDHHLIDDTALLAWLDNHDRQFGFIKERLQPFVRVADLFEYAWLFEYGGLFVDLDFVAVRALDPLILSVDGEVLLGTVEMPNLRLRPRNRVPNAFMYSASADTNSGQWHCSWPANGRKNSGRKKLRARCSFWMPSNGWSDSIPGSSPASNRRHLTSGVIVMRFTRRVLAQ